MPADYLHNHPDFAALIRIVAAERGIDPAMVEKDYWLTHGLYGLQKQSMKFALKGGTSLSKGHQIIDRFSEDIDILIEPPGDRHVATGSNQNKPKHIESRKDFYDWLAKTIGIEGITKVERDTAFDEEKMRSGGIRLFYRSHVPAMKGLKEGVLLEAGFDDVAPNEARDISSWLYDYAKDKDKDKVEIIDNRAKGVPCYDPRYTFVEKLQTISTKFRKQQETGDSPHAFMRHYYDVYNLLRRQEVKDFIGTPEYTAHKTKRFRGNDNLNIAENQAFVLADKATRNTYTKAFTASTGLYYGKPPSFEQVLTELGTWAARL
jgi:Nucleotidyl transferase AbiEii toxin, Type IV TA system